MWLLLTILSSMALLSLCKEYDPGVCDRSTHKKIKLVKDREMNEILVVCTKNHGIFSWKAVDGFQHPGEFFDPAYDCSDILNKKDDAKDGFYWINFDSSKAKKVWCDMNTDGGGYMLIGRKRGALTLIVPSNNKTVEPDGDPHWSSAFGDAPILDFRIQMATKEDFAYTKAHWSYRLKRKRKLKHLLVAEQDGCEKRSAGIGNIAYVKDLRSERIVTANLRCSKFGYGHSRHSPFIIGWKGMNFCLEKPCPKGFSFHPTIGAQLEYTGAFSFSIQGNVSGIEHDATAFVGCDHKRCCGCYGPEGGTKNYCSGQCQAINGGTVTKNVFTWFWVRSSLPKKAWKKCIEYKVLESNRKFVWYKIPGGSSVPIKGRCGKNNALLYNGIVVVPDASSIKKIPPAAGLLAYRKDSKELYIRANETWKVIGQKDKVNKKFSQLENQLITLINTKSSRDKVNLQFNQLKKQLKTINQSIFSITNLHYSECSGYKWLTDVNRNIKDSSSIELCDSGLSTGWYRFGEGAGTQMPTSCVSKNGCGTYGAGWMNGAHPSVDEGKVTRTVCYHWGSGCCQWSNNIEVVNCGIFYVYKLSAPPVCTLRYCGRDV